MVVPTISAFAPLGQTEGVIASIFAPAPVPAGYAAHVGAGLTLRSHGAAAATPANPLAPAVPSVHTARVDDRVRTMTADELEAVIRPLLAARGVD